MKQKLSLIITLCLVLAILAAGIEGFSGGAAPDVAAPEMLKLTNAEFSTDGGESFQPYADGEMLKGHRGDVVLRGSPETAVAEGAMLSVHLRHMALQVLADNEAVYSFAVEQEAVQPDECADLWVSFALPALSADSVVELRLYGQHFLGPEGAQVAALADSLCLGDPYLVDQWYGRQHMVERAIGQLMLMVGITLLGVSLASMFMKNPLHRILLFTSLLAMGEGAYWLAGASAVMQALGDAVALHSMVSVVCQVLVTYGLITGVSQLLLRRSARAGRIAASIHGIACIVYVLFCTFGSHTLCRYDLIWHVAQAPFLLAMFVLCIPEVLERKYTLRHRFFILAHMVVFASFLLAIVGQHIGWNWCASAARIVGGMMAICYAAALFSQVPASYEAIQSAKKLTEELSQSRIVLAMSQISTHFIFNVLNAISSLCKSDPEQADVELVRFARYLRTNIDIMQEDKLIPFEREMDHVQNYVDLEQLRFDDRIMLDEQYEVTDFMLPSLIVQPLVENAIKHGILPKKDGGTICLSTRRQGADVVIEIADDGVGFEARSRSTHKSVGLSNVRFRVEKMAGGRLEVESKLGEGTLVRVTLPYQKEVTA